MRVFVTGASGFVGSAVVNELINAGHQVLGLARSSSSAEKIIAAGAEVLMGDLDNLESLKSGALQADGVIHTGFIHDFSNFEKSCETDRRVIEAIGEVLMGTNKPFIITSGIGLLSPGRLITEDDRATAETSPHPRRVSEEAAEALAQQGVNVSIVRLPPSVHDAGDHGFVPILINIARDKGEAAYNGDGQNRWPAVHRLDAALLYKQALEKNSSWAIYHAVGEEGIPFADIAGIISKNLNISLVSKTPEEAAAYFGWFAYFTSLNCPAASQQTREALNWEPTHRGLLADMDSDAYFNQ